MNRSIAVLFSLPMLILLAAEPSAEVPRELVDELSPLLEEALSSEEGDARAWALRARTLQGGRDVRQLLLDNRDNSDLRVRVFVGLGLIDLGRREGAETLAGEIVSANPASRRQLLSRYVRHLSPDQQAEVLGQALDALTDPDSVRDVLSYVARHGEGETFALFERLAEADDSSRTVYTEVLASSARPEAAAVAGALLASPDASVRLAAVRVAAVVGGVEARAVLEEALTDSDASVSAAAAFALAPLGVVASYERLLVVAQEGESSDRARALEAIRDGQPELLEFDALFGMIASATDDILRQRIYEALGASRSDEAYNLLTGMLANDIYMERFFAIAGLGYTGREEVVAMLAEVLLGGGRSEMRELAAAGLGHLELTSATESLLQALDRERTGPVKLAVIRALGSSGSDAAMWPLAFQLTSPDGEVVSATLETLAELQATAVAPQVETVATSHREPDVRWRATLVLFGLDPEVGRIRLQQALDRPPEGFMSDIDALPEGPRVAAYRRLVTHPNPDYRALAASRILRLPDGGIAILRELTSAVTPSDIRELAVAELTANRAPEDLALFTDMAESTSRVMRAQALEALVELALPESEALLRALLEAPEMTRRAMGVYGLYNLGPPPG